MVESGQHSNSPAIPDVIDIAYRHPGRTRLGLEVLTFAELSGRLRAAGRAGTVLRPDFHQIVLVTGGSGAVMVDFINHDCAPNTLLHLRPGQVQRWPGSQLQAVLLLFTPAFPPRSAPLGTLLAQGPTARPLPPGTQDVLHRALADIAQEHDAPGEHGTELLRHLLAAVLLRIARLPDPSGAPVPHRAAAEVFHRFQRELERSFATTRHAHGYAARLGYSSRTLTRACRAATGRTAKELIDARVALEAKRLLVHTELPVAAISRRLGFGEPTNFGKFFTRETGSTPGTFRARERAMTPASPA